MTEDETSATRDGSDPAGALFPLVIAVTPAPPDRIRLAELLDGVAPLLLVANLDELRNLIAPQPNPDPAGAAAAPPAPDDALVLDPARSAARYRDREIGLTRLERDLLACLTTEPVRAWSYAELHRSVWHDDGSPRKAGVQSLVKRLRRKLDQLHDGVAIVAVRGVGFRLAGHRLPGRPVPDRPPESAGPHLLPGS